MSRKEASYRERKQRRDTPQRKKEIKFYAIL